MTVDEVYAKTQNLSDVERRKLADLILHDLLPSEPPGTFHNVDELKAMLSEGLDKGEPVRITPAFWEERQWRTRARLGGK